VKISVISDAVSAGIANATSRVSPALHREHYAR
jgi:hypothetical protein